MANFDDDGTTPYFNGLPAESLEEYRYDVEAQVHFTKTEDRWLRGPRLLCRIGGIPGALARRDLKPQDLAKINGDNLILVFPEERLQEAVT